MMSGGSNISREKERDSTRSYNESPYTNRKFNNQIDKHKNATKPSITQRLPTDLGRPVGETTSF